MIDNKSTTSAADAYAIREYLRTEGILLSYSGILTENVLSGIGATLRTKLELDGTDRKTSRLIFAVFVEQVQNVIRYSAELEQGEIDNEPTEIRYGVLTVGRKDGSYFVSCGNLVEKATARRLDKSLTRIQGMSKGELKDLYKETLRGETPEGSKGAGVGFIEIARRAGGRFEFDIAEIDDAYAYFLIKAFI